MAAPGGPARGKGLAGFEVERDAEAVGGARIGIVGGGHAKVHDRVALAAGELLFFPHGIEEALDAAVVPAVGEAALARGGEGVVTPGLALGLPVALELVQ